MEGGFQLKQENPRKKASFLSKLTFAWLIKLYRKGVKKGLEVVDLYKVLDDDSSQRLGDELARNWDNEIKQAVLNDKKPSLLKAVTKTFFWGYMLYGISLFILYVIVKSYQPVVLAYLINLFMVVDEDTFSEKYVSGSILVGMSIITIFMNHHTNFWLACVGMRMRIACSTLVYRKVMKLNQKAMGQTAIGQVVNLLSNDVSRFDMITLVLHYLWIMPIQAALITYLIWQEVGISALAGVVSMALLSLPVQGYLGKVTSHLRLKVAQRTDHRVKLMSEIISGIQVIKMYAWEKPFEQIVRTARRKEINTLTSASYVRGVYQSCMVFIERSALFLSVVCFVLLGNVITADKVFSMAQFYNVLQLSMAIFYPMAISFGAESLVALRRLEDFLALDEIEEPSIQHDIPQGIIMSDIQASWVGGTPNLENISANIPPGILCAIVGPVGSGKSSILQLLLGELKPSTGSIRMGGEISYCSQEPWLYVSTVRNNILFGTTYNKDLYKKVVRVCALEKDFDQFPQRDKTMVGERGVSLSGGQRARINLARAIYRQADIYLLDDPLSAVDTHVGRHLFDECIVKHLKGKTRILVTHQLQYLKKADLIIVLGNGTIEAQGTFEDLSRSEMNFTKLLVSADETDEKEKGRELERRTSVLSNLSGISESCENETGQTEERIPTDASALKDYFSAAGNMCVFAILVIILLLGQIACSASDYWVTIWTQQEAIRHSNNTVLLVTETTPILERISFYGDDGNFTESVIPYYTYTMEDNVITETIIVNNSTTLSIFKTNISIYIYTVLIIAAIIVTLLRSFLFFKLAMNASKNLHKKMFHALLEAPMRFFDTNPSGRVLNRFSKDMGSIDEILPRTLLEAIQIFLVMGGILVMVCISNYYMIIAIVILGSLFWKMREWYILTAKDIKHIEGITKSPVFSHLSSSLHGLVTIRASKAQEILIREFDAHQDVHSSAWYLTLSCMFSFGLWLDMICVTFLGCIVYSFILLDNFTGFEVNGSLVGLAISQSIILTGMLQFGVKQSAEVINQLISVERVMQYTKLDKEGSFKTPQDKRITLPWPEKGIIEFRNLSLRYSPTDPPVLRNLYITIRSGEKIGIVGRTGAGKTSLISALFKLTNLEGSILIDGIDSKNVGLHDLRKKISIIPQEPVLFSATLRYNLDPFYEYSDDKLWKALEDVELGDSVTSLDYAVMQGGSNFSLGQRQLLCLARAILRNNKILVLDEATANVDPRTDGLIQGTIRKKFKDCTVLTIAHRLNTIMDSDKVLVMASGSVVEFDHPHILLQNEDGYFYKMVAETGSSMMNQLTAVAKHAFDNIHS